MSRELDDALEGLATGLDEEDVATVLSAASQLRQRLQTLLADRRLEPEDPLLAERRHLHHHLTVLEDKARAGRFEDAQEDREAIEEQARHLAEAIQARPVGDDQPPGALALRRVSLVARREARVRWAPALGVAVLVGLVLGLALQTDPRAGLERAWTAAREPLLAAAALGGLAVGAGTLADDRRTSRLHLLVGHGLSRVGVVSAKLAAVGALLWLATIGPGLLVGLFAALAGAPVTAAGLVVPLLALWLAATSFAAFSLALEAAGHGLSSALVAGLGAYVLAGPIWRAAFLAGGSAGSLGADLVYLSSPLAAVRHLLAEPTGSAVAALLVPAAWTLLLGGAAAALARRGLAVPASERN